MQDARYTKKHYACSLTVPAEVRSSVHVASLLHCFNHLVITGVNIDNYITL